MSWHALWISLRASVGFALGIGVPFGVLFLALWHSRTFLPAEGSRNILLALYCSLPGLIPAVLVVATLVLLPRWRSLSYGLLVGSAIAYLLILYIMFGNPFAPEMFGPPRTPGPKDSLLIASGREPSSIDPLRPDYSRDTAEELNRTHHGSEYLEGITYVPADVPSTGPLVVSVNPIDDYTWGAAALSQRGRCYLILAVADRSNPRYGSTRFGWFDGDRPCVGAAATRQTVVDKDWPPGNY